MAEVVLKHKGSYKMKCLVVDDESIAIRGIVNYISKLDFLEVAGSCSSALEAADILKTTEIDLDGFRLHVVDYLMKPIGFQRFFQAVSKARDLFLSQLVLRSEHDETASSMYVRQGDAFQRIVWRDILYAEGMQNYVRLYFKDKVLTIHQTMTSLEEMLPKESFFRIHRSFLINLSHIDSISGGRLFINGKELPVSKQRREELLSTVVYKNLISK